MIPLNILSIEAHYSVQSRMEKKKQKQIYFLGPYWNKCTLVQNVAGLPVA